MTEDFIPMHWKIGDEIQIQFSDDGDVVGTFPCKVVKSEQDRALVRSVVGQYYLIDIRRDNKITKLTDYDRCRDCGNFFCECNKEQSMTNHDVTPVPIPDLDEMGNDDVIKCVEGTLKTLYQPREEGNYKRQNGVLVDDNGNEHRITFAVDKVFQDQDKKGKRVRITCNFGKRDPTGVKMKVSKGGNTVYRKIWVTGTAHIEWIQDGKTQGQRGGAGNSTQGGAVQAENTSSDSAKLRIHHYFQVFELVNKAYESGAYEVPELCTEDLRSITTGICAGFKGQYGVYARPILPNGDNGGTQSTDSGAKKESNNNFAEVTHPKSGKALSEYDNPKVAEFLAWAYAYNGDDTKWRKFQAAVMAVAEEKGISAKNAFEIKGMKEEEEFSKDALDKYSMKVFGVSYDELESEDFQKILKGYPEAIKEIIKIEATLVDESDDEDLPE